MSGTNLDWQNIDRYLEIHESCLEQVEEYFVVMQDVRDPVAQSSTDVHFKGALKCHGAIEIHVDVWLERNEGDKVRGVSFSYHAQISESRVVPILRYDNAPHDASHPDAFHKHLFDAEGQPAGVQHIGRDHFPTLRNVIDEVFEWWKANRDDPRYYPKK